MLKIKQVPIRVGATATYEWSDGWAAALTYMTKYGDTVQMFKRDGECIQIPRGLADLSQMDPAHDHRVPGQQLPLIEPALGPRNDDQRQVLGQSLAYLKAGVDHIIEAPTGFGKTFLGVALGLAMNCPVLIVVTKEDLVHGWRRMLLNPPDHPEHPGMGLPPDCVGHAQADKLVWEGKRFVIGMIHSLSKEGKYPAEFWNHFGMGIFDEVHRLGADTFQEVCYLLPAKTRLGLSATPDRKDGKDRTFNSHIGPVLVRGKTIPMKPKILRKRTAWRIPDGVPYSPGRMGTVYGIMGRNNLRNALITEFVVKAFKADRVTVIMSELVDNHLKILFHQLAAAGIGGEHIGYYIGQSTNDKHKAKLALEEAARKRVILATYGMCKEGTDFPFWDTLVLATPVADCKQAIGRVMRLKKDKKEPVILDLVDDSRIFQTFAKQRLVTYYSVGATIVDMDNT